MSESEKILSNNHKLLDVLLASPYLSQTSMDGWLTEERFKELFIEYKSYFELFLANYIDADKQQFFPHHHCFLK